MLEEIYGGSSDQNVTSFRVTIDNLEGRIITLFGGACFHEAGAELVFSVPRVIVIIEDTYTAHNNKAALSSAAHKSFSLAEHGCGQLCPRKYSILPENEVT